VKLLVVKVSIPASNRLNARTGLYPNSDFFISKWT